MLSAWDKNERGRKSQDDHLKEIMMMIMMMPFLACSQGCPQDIIKYTQLPFLELQFYKITHHTCMTERNSRNIVDRLTSEYIFGKTHSQVVVSPLVNIGRNGFWPKQQIYGAWYYLI
jgi:hypothetical protein